MSVPQTRTAEGDRFWRIARYHDAMLLLKSEDVTIVETVRDLKILSDRLGGDNFPNLIRLFGTSHPFQNGAAHRAAHESIRAWMGTLLRRWTPDRIDRLTEDLLAPAMNGHPVDAVELLACALPATIIADALGMSVAQLRRSSETTRKLFSVWHRDSVPLRELRALEAIAAEQVMFLQDIFGEGCEDEHAKIALLSLAGFATTAGLIAGAIHFLAADPALQEKLRREPTLVPGFINETLRVRPPLRRIVGRRANVELALLETVLPSGALFVIDIERAQRDPVAFANPDRFDIYRAGPPGLAFGAGAHACLGAALARLEARIVIERLMRNSIIHPAGDPMPHVDEDWNEFLALPVRFERRAAA